MHEPNKQVGVELKRKRQIASMIPAGGLLRRAYEKRAKNSSYIDCIFREKQQHC